MKYCLNKQGALLVYKNMILPLLEYGDIFLSSLSVATRKKLQVMQNKALRIALNSRNQESTADLHKLAKLSKLKDRRKMHVLQFMFKKKNEIKLLARKPVGRTTRSSGKILFKLRKPVTEKYKRCISYSGHKSWNQLPSGIQTIENLLCFKYRIKTIFDSVPKGPDS